MIMDISIIHSHLIRHRVVLLHFLSSRVLHCLYLDKTDQSDKTIKGKRDDVSSDCAIIALWVCSVMDINIQLRQPVMATHITIMDIHNDNSNMDIQNSVVDICHPVMDIHY